MIRRESNSKLWRLIDRVRNTISKLFGIKIRKVFTIELDRLDPDFVEHLDFLFNTYGKEMQMMNNMHNTQLNFSDFIDAFIDAGTPADVSADGNANSSAKDVCTLTFDMMKPHTKLLGYNKIFYEMKKFFGLEAAKTWLTDEWLGALYMHDPSSVSLKPYSYKGSETVVARYKGSDSLLINMSDLFNLVDEPVELLSFEDKAICKYTNDLEVWDVNGWVKASRVVCHARDQKFRFIKTENGMTEVVTANHPLITTNRGDINAADAIVGEDILTALAPQVSFGNVNDIYVTDTLLPKGFPIYFRGFVADETSYGKEGFVSYNKGTNPIPNHFKIDYDFGWLVGMLLGDGSLASRKSRIFITQKRGEVFDKIIEVLEKIGLGYYVNLKSGYTDIYTIAIRSHVFTDFIHVAFIPPSKSYDKRLNPDILKYNKEFIRGVIGGVIDSDGTIGGAKERCLHIRVTSRHMITQLGHLIRMFGYNTREQLPSVYTPCTSEDKFTQNHYIYHLAVTPYSDMDWFDSIKAKKILKNLNSSKESSKYCNDKYKTGFGDFCISNNFELNDAFDHDEFVYDITTETGHFMCNGILSHNCFAYDLDQLVEKGLFFVNKFPTGPAQHLTTYNDHVLEFISWNCNRTSGAVGLPSYLVYSWYFWNKDVKDNFYLRNPEYYRRQCFQKFVFDLNQPYLRVD